ncbi:hypothetical protein BCR32DRAFT_297732 [Anaeromyces robustus]|uniref:DNA-directed RNA polymerase n=1 Tax=Anaeromyces robustus TaxID=1754192 RepID=A0A1Y1VW21_9FUNG|nr:hypothetical protein BCR32DRAFT_297732 [Anaeromyces robustus]|eukprot:ORX65403.1 hypothetical protein BCR32DRAFT_297732 [Anaeromyces robustus]
MVLKNFCISNTSDISRDLSKCDNYCGISLINNVIDSSDQSSLAFKIRKDVLDFISLFYLSVKDISYNENIDKNISKKKKSNSKNFKPDKFAEIIINRIDACRYQTIGKPVIQSALSYFHKFSGGEENINGLNELNQITHNLIIINSTLSKNTSKYNTSKDKKPASKFLDWLNSKGIDYIVDADMLCIYKIKETSSEKDKRYLILDSNYINITYENIKELLDNITLTGTGTKGVKKITFKYQKVDNDLRKQSILKQLERITTTDNSNHSTQHIELFTDFICRNNSITPMSRYGMRENNYPFYISNIF